MSSENFKVVVFQNSVTAKVVASRSTFFRDLYFEPDRKFRNRVLARSVRFQFDLPVPLSPNFPPEVFVQAVSILIDHDPGVGFVCPPVGGTFKEWLKMAKWHKWLHV